jgi:hypothetical protein
MSCRFGNLKFECVSGSLNELKACTLSLDQKILNSGLVDVNVRFTALKAVHKEERISDTEGMKQEKYWCFLRSWWRV